MKKKAVSLRRAAQDKKLSILQKSRVPVEPEPYCLSMPPNILLLKFGRKRKIMRSTTHQLSLSTKPLTVLLIPPKSSPTGSGGMEKCNGTPALRGTNAESRLPAGETAGVGSGGQAGGGNTLLLPYERLRPIIKPPFTYMRDIKQTLNS